MTYIPTTEPIVDRGGVMTKVFRALVTLIAPGARGGLAMQLIAGRAIGWGTAAPIDGEWTRGDLVFNSAAAVGQPIAWSCTVTGSPGTWVPWANL